MMSAPDSKPGLPDAKDLEALRKRFANTDLNNPGTAALFNYALERLPSDGSTTRKPGQSDIPENIIPLDPINIVQMEVHMPPLPAVLGELQEVTSKRFVSASDVGAVVSKDPSLTAWLLKLVNSPFFGFSNKVDTVTRAITLLGIEQFKTMAMGSMIHSLTNQIPPKTINLDIFWRHSVGTALAAQNLWKLLKRDEPERLFVAGLLHDCGLLALAYAAPKTFIALSQAVSNSTKPRYQAEQELMGFNHARLGGMLMHRWNMPLKLIMAILHHHQVEDPVRQPEAAVVHLADVVARATADDNEDCVIPTIDPVVWNSLGLKGTNLTLVADSMLERLSEMCEMLKN